MNSKVTITVKRRPRRGFVGPRRVGDSGGQEAGSDVKKKRELSPVFVEVLRKLEEKDERPKVVPTEEGEKMGVDKGEVQAVAVKSEASVPEGRGEHRAETIESSEEGSNEVVEEAPKPNLSAVKRFGPKKALSGPLHESVVPPSSQNSSTQSSAISAAQEHIETDEKKFYEAVYAKASTRKHKRMECDGFIIVTKGSKGPHVVLKDGAGETVESSNNCKLDSDHLEGGKIFQLGGKEVQISEKLNYNPLAKGTNRPPPDTAKIPEAVQEAPKLSPPRGTKRKLSDPLHESVVPPSSQNSSTQLSISATQEHVEEKTFYEAVYAKASTRKHKKMECDGYLIVTRGSRGIHVVLKDGAGETIESSNSYKLDSEHLEDGKIFQLGGKEVQISEKLSHNPLAKGTNHPPPDTSMIKQLGKLRKIEAANEGENVDVNNSFGDIGEVDVQSDVSFTEARSGNRADTELIDCCKEEIRPEEAPKPPTFYEAVYAKASTRKHKKMECDGFIIVTRGTHVVLKDGDGKTVESSNNCKLDSEHFEDGKIFQLGGKEVQISEKLNYNPLGSSSTSYVND